MKYLLAILPLFLLVSCASGPSQREKNDFFILRQNVIDTEDEVYGDRVANTPGLYGHLKACSVNLHYKINSTEPFKWSEKMERFTDAYHADDDLDDISRNDFRVVHERYNHFKISLDSNRDSYRERIRSCKSDLVAIIRKEKEQLLQETIDAEAEQQANSDSEQQALGVDQIIESEVSTPAAFGEAK